MLKKEPGHVNFSDWVGQNKEGIKQMGGRVQQTQDELQGYANRGRNELKQAVQERAGSSEWDGDYTKLDEFGHFKDSTNAFNDYQADSQNNQGRQMQLYNQYQGQATAADAALLYGRGGPQAANNQKPQGWNNYLQGVEQISGESAAKYQRQQAAQKKALADAQAAAANQAGLAAQQYAVNSKIADYNHKTNPGPTTAGTYGAAGVDANMLGLGGKASKGPVGVKPTEPAGDGYQGFSYDPNSKATRDEQERAFYQTRQQAWKKYYEDLDAYNKANGIS